jgi:hypothetical protein
LSGTGRRRAAAGPGRCIASSLPPTRAVTVRFHLKRTDRDIDLGFYSRKRQINQKSSFSVLG